MAGFNNKAVPGEEYICCVIADIVQWINSSLSGPLDIGTVAQKAGYSRWYFQRLFNHATGIPLGKYIRARRMELAAELLVSTDMNVSDIIVEVGYESAAVFTRSFKKHFGITPGYYRKKYGSHDLCVILQ